MPDRRLVLVSTANNNTQENLGAALRILYDDVLPAAGPMRTQVPHGVPVPTEGS